MSAPKLSHQFDREPRRIGRVGSPVSRSRALRVFCARTGRDPQSDDALKTWIVFIQLGLDAEARSSRVRVQAGDEDTQPPRTPKRGHPELNPLLTETIAGLVDEIGPSNAALLLMLFGCDASRAFPIFRTGAVDTPKTLRQLAQRLSQIRGRARRRPGPDLTIVFNGATWTSCDPATGTFRGSIPGAGARP